MSTVPSTLKRLQWFIDAIFMEERKFRLWNHQLHLDFRDLEKMHLDGICRKNGCAMHLDIRNAHEEIFARHRRMRSEHNDAKDYCRTLMQRLESGHHQAGDLTHELEKLSTFYETIRADHNQMVKERRQVVAEHQAVMQADSRQPTG